MPFVSLPINLLSYFVNNNRPAQYFILFHCNPLELIICVLNYLSIGINLQINCLMGNNRSEVQVAFQLDKEFYYAGDTLNGKLLINAKKKFNCSMIVLFIDGAQTCQFLTEGKQIVKGETELIKTSHILHKFQENQELKGQHVFPFSFKFMNYLPGSYNESKDYKAQIVYMLKARLQPHAKKKSAIETSIEIIIRQPQKQGERMLQGECYSKCTSCSCFNKGTSRVVCFFQKNYYFPQDECIMICEVDNLKSKVNMARVNCSFIKEVTLTGNNDTLRVFSKVINVMEFSGIEAGSSYYGQTAQRNTVKLIYKDTGLGVHPTTSGKCVKCEYYILVKPQFSGCLISAEQNECKVKLNILQPAMIYEPIEEPDSWRPQIEENVNIYLQFSKHNDNLTSMTGEL